MDTPLKAAPETRGRARKFSVSATTHNCLGHRPEHNLFSILLASRVQIASPVVHQYDWLGCWMVWERNLWTFSLPGLKEAPWV